MIHEMKLFDEPYDHIIRGNKYIELRLCDEKRKKINPNDTIIFTNIKTQQSVAVKVKHIYKAKTFRELFEEISNPASMGFDVEDDIDNMVLEMREYYSEEKEKEYGVVGIEFYQSLEEIESPEKYPEEY